MAAEQDFRKDEEGKTPSADGSSTVNIVVGDGPPPKPGADEPGQPLQVCKDGVQGMCWEPYMCVKYGGSTESGHCSGGNDNACCVAYQESPLPDQGGEIPKPIFFGSKTGPREAALLAAIGSVGIKGIEACQFMAQMAHESDQFKAMEEYASGSAYEGRSDLGNTQPGDGKRYKGRGYIQLTGRANYITFGKKLGLDLVGHPEQASDPPIAAKVAISYWMKRVRPRVTDFTDTRRVTRLINGGTNGLSDRISKFSKYKAAGMQPVAAASGEVETKKNSNEDIPKPQDPEDNEPVEQQGAHGNAAGMAIEARTDNAEQVSSTTLTNSPNVKAPEDTTPAPQPGDGSPGQPLQRCKGNIEGMCWEPYMCVKYGGKTKAGHCTGGNDNSCCQNYKETPVPSEGGEIPKPIFFGSKTGPREAALLAAIGSVGIKGIEACQFMAQMAHESDQFKAMEEYASGSAYEGRSDLGNTQPGDGKRYKGRGYIQLTGRANYITFGKKLGLDLVGHPEQASDPPIAAKVAISYWMKRVRPRVTDFTDTRRVTRLINGGTNGLSDRISKFSKYKAAGMQPVAEAGKLDPSNSGKHDPVDTEPAEEQGGRGNSKGMSTESKENSMDQIGVNEGTPGDCTGAKAWADALKHPEIHFNSFHPSGVKDNANAKAEAVAASKGRRAERSAYEGAPGGVTCLEKGMAQFLIALADEIGGVTVNEIAGGSHSFKSSHYAGHAVDIGKVEGKRMDSSNPHLKKTVELCKRFGANWACTADKSFTKCSSHKTWTHCQWNKWKGELSVDEMRKAKGWPK